MSSISKEQRETLALIDAILAMVEKTPDDLPNGVNVSLNPFEFIMGIIMKVVTFDEMMDFLVKVITFSLPTIELGVKGAILANLKATIDCNNDPRIPNWIRKESGEEKEGLIFNLNAIDFRNMMSVSPLSDDSRLFYFGTNTYFTIDGDEDEDKKYINRRLACGSCAKQGIPMTNIVKHSECDNVYQLARANDFNAFLWFVVHKGYLTPKNITSTTLSEYEEKYKIEEQEFTKKPFEASGKENNLGVIESTVKLTAAYRQPPFSPGNSITHNGGNLVSLCIKGESEKIEQPVYDYDEFDYLSDVYLPEVVVTGFAPRDYNFTMVPVSSDNVSINWYVNSGTFFNFLKKKEDRIPRDYGEEYPICNLRYLNNNNSIYFTILPKPLVHLPHEGEPLWRVKPILFNSSGEPDPKGKYSVYFEDANGKRKSHSIPSKTEEGYEYTLSKGKLIINAESGEYYLNNEAKENIESVLRECYPKLTVYEFNYDYVMGMQLFDPTVVSAQLIESIMNIRNTPSTIKGFNANINKSETAYQMRIAEIVKNIVESTAYEVSDCFYTFDNTKYDKMLNDAELKRSQLYVNTEDNKSAKQNIDTSAYDILNEFDNNATLNENKEVIKRAITQATATITQEVLPEDKYSIECNIVSESIRVLVVLLVETLLTPKLVMLFEVNRRLMGQQYTIYNIEDFIESIQGLLVSIISEIRDLILQQLLDWCIKILVDLNVKAVELLVKEQLEYYSRLMKLLFKACSFKASHRSPLDTKLDVVEYPDIDEIDKPKEANC